MKKFKIYPLILCIFYLITSCSSDDNSNRILSTEKEILSFQFLVDDNPAMNQNFIGEINQEDRSITLLLQYSYGVNLEELTPHIEASDKATISSLGEQDFTEDVIYTITAEDGSSQTYTVSVTLEVSIKDILLMLHAENPDNTLSWNLEDEIDTWEGVSVNTDGFIISLILSDKNLTTIPETFGLLTHLAILNLNDNQLIEVPSEVQNLSGLITLSLGNNQLTEIPTQIGQLTSLNSLVIYGNEIGMLPAQINQLTNLKTLSLGNNQFSTFPTEVLELTSLENLYLNGNNLTSVPAEISQLTLLTNLDFGSNSITSIPAEIGELVQLESLYLANNNLTTIPQSVCDLETTYGTTITIDPEVICN